VRARDADADLFLGGIDLTRDEIDLLYRTDAALWLLSSALRGAPRPRITERENSHVD
jgi:hypothetical protein